MDHSRVRRHGPYHRLHTAVYGILRSLCYHCGCSFSRPASSFFEDYKDASDAAKHNVPKKKRCKCCKCWTDFTKKNPVLYLVLKLLLRAIAVITVGALIYLLDYSTYENETRKEESNKGFVDFLYYSIITTTTIGFGDDAPQSPWGRLLASAYLFFAVNEFMNTLTQLAELPSSLQNAKREANVLSQYGDNLSASELRSVILLSCDDPNSTKCSKEEFILGMLVRQNKLSAEDIGTIGKQFDKYDVDRSGALDVNDISDDCDADEAKTREESGI